MEKLTNEYLLITGDEEMEKLKHFSLFSGIESFKKALTNLGIDNELVGYSEFDKYASVALSAIHGVSEDLNYGDITKIDETKLPDCDLITYGFPCQDISVAGHQKGIVEGETRSGLLYDALRIIKYKMPKYAIAENVKNLVGKKFKDDFNSLLEELDSYGYNNYWQVLNAKDYGIPQNRERVFIVSIRKDIDVGTFEFPKPYDSGLRLKDLLEDEVEEKYYIDNERTNELIERLKDGKKGTYPNVEDGPKVTSALSSREHRGSGWDDVVGILCARDYKDPKVVAEPLLVGGIGEKNFGKQYRQGNRVYDSNAVAMCLLSQPVGNAGGYSYLYTVEDKQTSNDLKLFTNLEGGKWDKIHESARRVYDEEGIAPTIPTCGDKRVLEPKEKFGRMGRQAVETLNENDVKHGDTINPFNKRVSSKDGISPTLTTRPEGFKTAVLPVSKDFRIRKLTPKECWRLMGFADDDYHKARQALEDRFYNGKDRSNSQMYKMAGNSIVVDVLEGILDNLIN